MSILNTVRLRFEPIGLRHVDDTCVADGDPVASRFVKRAQPESVAGTLAAIAASLGVGRSGDIRSGR